ncbi:MAG: diguanylate cyclase [Rhodocyclaceae bacterium]|nr:diguanylate cyclase [Rhodocyclaceae bacterium]
MQSAKSLSKRMMLFRIFVAMVSVEFVIMVLLERFPPGGSAALANVLDAILLGCLATPWIYVWVVRPFVLERDSALQESARQARTDHLTGLANRRQFREFLATEHGRHQRSGGDLAVILVDVDHFKKFNDAHGHLRGDDCLQQIASAIASCATRPGDLVARYGGEEFVLVLPETDLAGARKIGEEIRHGVETLAIPHGAEGAGEHVTVSVGVAAGTSSRGVSSMALVAGADEMLYRAKSEGRNRVEAASRRATAGEVLPTGIEFDAKYRCGNAHIDAQHERIIRQTDRLLLALAGPESETTFEDEVVALLRLIAEHFRDEIVILRKLDFAGADAHAKEHSRLLQKAAGLLREYRAGDAAPSTLFHFFTRELVFEHLLQSDGDFFTLTARAAHVAP